MSVINTVGRRKTSVARVYMEPGKGEIVINKRKSENYFATDILQTVINQPFAVSETAGKFNIKANIKGGGFTGQAEALRLAISRALCEADAEYRPLLKKEGFLTRDSRKVERKKYGRRKARKKFQFSKR